MKLSCPLSGLSFEVDGFGSLKGKQIHPLFSCSSKEVIGTYLAPALSGKLDSSEVHLFGAFLLSKLPVERWDSPLLSLASGNYWETFWAKHLESLSSAVLRIDGKEISRLPVFAVQSALSSEGSPLGNIKDWLSELHLRIAEYYEPISDEAKKRNKVFRAEIGETQYTSEEECNALIEKALRGSLLSDREKAKFPGIIASWAARVGEFPMAFFTKESGEKVTIHSYWKGIIQAAFDLDPRSFGIGNILSDGVTVEDLDELLEHCQVNIPVGTMQSRALFRELEKVKEVINEFRPSSSGSMKSLGASIEVLSSREVADILHEVSSVALSVQLKDTDPLAPRKEDYPTLSSYVKAKARYAELKKAETAEKKGEQE